MITMFAVLCGSGAYYGPGFLFLCIDASRSLVAKPATIADDLQNEQIHAARHSLRIE